jgi:hypothetical protein
VAPSVVGACTSSASTPGGTGLLLTAFGWYGVPRRRQGVRCPPRMDGMVRPAGAPRTLIALRRNSVGPFVLGRRDRVHYQGPDRRQKLGIVAAGMPTKASRRGGQQKAACSAVSPSASFRTAPVSGSRASGRGGHRGKCPGRLATVRRHRARWCRDAYRAPGERPGRAGTDRTGTTHRKRRRGPGSAELCGQV